MSTYNPLPPHVLHTDTHISQTEALRILTTFLDRTQNEPAYRPDSHLTERGPVSSSTNANSDLTLHHLHRIKFGLEGKRLRPDLEAEGGGIFSNPKRKRKREDEDNPTSTFTSSPPLTTLSAGESRQEGTASTTPNTKDWQDKWAYEEAQDDSDVDVNNARRDPGAGLQQHQPIDETEEEEEMVDVEADGIQMDPRREESRSVGGPRESAPVTGMGRATPKKAIESKEAEIWTTTPATIDKEERKRLKRLRKKTDKAERAQARAAKAS